MWQEYGFSLEALNLAVTRRCFPGKCVKWEARVLGVKNTYSVLLDKVSCKVIASIIATPAAATAPSEV